MLDDFAALLTDPLCRSQDGAGLHGVDVPRRLEPRRPGGRLAVGAKRPEAQGAQLLGAASIMLRQIFYPPLVLIIA
jgi:hypothetical protein